jgi:predicted dehydrogenase
MDFSYFVIGAGSIGRRHFENLKTLKRDVRLLPWRNFCITDLEGVLRAKSDKSAVVIATSTGIRIELITLCADLGVPMYIEKPLGYQPDELKKIYGIPGDLQRRSVVGFMMRYHPVVEFLAKQKPDQLFRSTFTIGHDVNQWRQNWRFSNSYASDPNGGGVLLDLCHEIDIAGLLAPDLELRDVSCLAHPEFQGVDIASSVAAHSSEIGLCTINMDYLAPKLVRRGCLEGLSEKMEYCLEDNTVRITTRKDTRTERFDIDRNQLFVRLMRDFVTLAEGNGKPSNPLCPRMDLVRNSCFVIAQAWANRQFVGQLEAHLQ